MSTNYNNYIDNDSDNLPPPLPCETIGPFKLVKYLGSGAFADVYLGIHEHTNEEVAIKYINKQHLFTTELSTPEALSNEINNHKILFHNNIARIYCTIETNTTISIVTEYCSNGDLLSHIITKGKLSESAACKIFHQIINALDYMHSQYELAHRDMKPENVLFNHLNEVKLCDFGLSKFYNDDNNNALLTTPCGSPIYAAPEMLLNKPYHGDRVDIWSAGVTLYAMVVGKLPFDDEDMQMLIKKITNGVFDVPRTLSCNCKDLMKRLLTVDDERRITFKEIKEHSWYKGVKERDGKGINIKEVVIPVDDEVVMMIVKDGVGSVEDVVRSVVMNKHDKVSVEYYLRVGKKVKDGNGSVSELSGKGKEIEEYLEKEESKWEYYEWEEEEVVMKIVKRIEGKEKECEELSKEKEMEIRKENDNSVNENDNTVNKNEKEQEKEMRNDNKNNNIIENENDNSENEKEKEKENDKYINENDETVNENVKVNEEEKEKENNDVLLDIQSDNKEIVNEDNKPDINETKSENIEIPSIIQEDQTNPEEKQILSNTINNNLETINISNTISFDDKSITPKTEILPHSIQNTNPSIIPPLPQPNPQLSFNIQINHDEPYPNSPIKQPRPHRLDINLDIPNELTLQEPSKQILTIQPYKSKKKVSRHIHKSSLPAKPNQSIHTAHPHTQSNSPIKTDNKATPITSSSNRNKVHFKKIININKPPFPKQNKTKPQCSSNSKNNSKLNDKDKSIIAVARKLKPQRKNLSLIVDNNNNNNNLGNSNISVFIPQTKRKERLVIKEVRRRKPMDEKHNNSNEYKGLCIETVSSRSKKREKYTNSNDTKYNYTNNKITVKKSPDNKQKNINDTPIHSNSNNNNNNNSTFLKFQKVILTTKHHTLKSNINNNITHKHNTSHPKNIKLKAIPKPHHRHLFSYDRNNPNNNSNSRYNNELNLQDISTSTIIHHHPTIKHKHTLNTSVISAHNNNSIDISHTKNNSIKSPPTYIKVNPKTTRSSQQHNINNNVKHVSLTHRHKHNSSLNSISKDNTKLNSHKNPKITNDIQLIYTKKDINCIHRELNSILGLHNVEYIKHKNIFNCKYITTHNQMIFTLQIHEIHMNKIRISRIVPKLIKGGEYTFGKVMTCIKKKIIN